MGMEQFQYDNKIVKAFIIATVVFGVVGMLVGLTIASQLFLPDLNFDTSFLTFGMLRPLHTNAIIFAFVGNGMFAGVYYQDKYEEIANEDLMCQSNIITGNLKNDGLEVSRNGNYCHDRIFTAFGD